MKEITDGWTSQEEIVSTKTFKLSKKIENFYFESSEDVVIKEIENNLITDLSEMIIKSKDLIVSEEESYLDSTKVISAKITIVPSGLKYINRTNNVFKINDIVFTNEELIEAVKSHFPERLI